MYWRGSKPFTSHAKRTDSREGSNLVMGPAPERPARRALQVDSVSVPTGVTSPMPVTTTRRANDLLPDLRVQVVHGVADGAHLFRVFIGDVDIELLLERHDPVSYTHLTLPTSDL